LFNSGLRGGKIMVTMEDKVELEEVIETLVCPVHKEHPDVEKQPDGSIKIHCCCSHFKTQCIYILHKMFGSRK
jgi:hypothetical protein